VKRARPSGFTLVELLVAIALLTIVVSLLIVPFLTARSLLARGSAQSDAQTAARESMETLQRELANAMYVFDQPAGDESSLAFMLPAVDDFGRLIQPVHPALDPLGRLVAIRYWGTLVNPEEPYNPYYGTIRGDRNPVILARTEVADAPATPLFPPDRASTAVDRTYPPFNASWNDFVIAVASVSADFNLPQEPLPPAGAPPGTQPGTFPRPLTFLINPKFTFAQVGDEVLRPREVGGKLDYSTLEGSRGLWTGDIQVSVFRTGQTAPVYTARMEDPTNSGFRRLIIRDDTNAMVYDTGQYPTRDASVPYGFGVDYIRGRLLFGFAREEKHPVPPADAGLRRVTLDASVATDAQLVAGSSFVEFVDVDGDVRYFTRSSRQPPGPGQYFEDGMDLVFAADDPAFLDLADPQIVVRYQFRTNLDTDRVHISYTTKEDITASLIISRQSSDRGGRQEFSMIRRITVQNARR